MSLTSKTFSVNGDVRQTSVRHFQSLAEIEGRDELSEKGTL